MPRIPIPTGKLRQQRDVCDRATPGPWKVIREDEDTGSVTMAIIPDGNQGRTLAWVPEDCNDNYRHDAQFIADAREMVPRLLDEVERLRAVLQAGLDDAEQFLQRDWGERPANYAEAYGRLGQTIRIALEDHR